MSDEIKAVLETVQRNFNEFKQKNDEKLAEIEKKGHADPLLTENVNKLSTSLNDLQKRLDEFEVKSKRLNFGQQTEADILKQEHKEKFLGWLKRGRNEDVLHELERKTNYFNATTEAEGGYGIPELIDRLIVDRLLEFSPMRQLCRVVTVGTPDYKVLVNIHGTGTGWVDEDDSRAATNAPQFHQASAYMGECYAYPQATQQILDDIFFDAESWLVQECVDAITIAEGTAFVTGSGTKQPKGFTGYTTAATADSSRTYGQLQHIATGTSGAFKTPSATVSQSDDLLSMIYAMKSGLRSGSSWLMNSATLALARCWKSYGDGAYIWQPSLQAGQPATLLGYPVYTEENMADSGTSGGKPIAFGNWKRGYCIVDRIGTRMLRDPFTNKPYVGFYVTKRVGGMVVDSDAIKILKQSAS